MFTVIDSAQPTTAMAASLVQAGVKTVIRYYNHKDVSIPGKRLTRAEAQALTAVGLEIGVVVQQRGGAGEPNGHIGDLTAMTGQRDAARALELAAEIGQPKGSAIYFAVDWDFVKASELASIDTYFEAVKGALGESFQPGVYGSGLIGDRLLAKGLVDFAWLAQSKGWTGYSAFLKSQRWALAQGPTSKWPGNGQLYDPNYTNTAYPDFGQFRLGSGGIVKLAAHGASVTHDAIMAVTARSGLRLRRGPGTSYPQIKTLPLGTQVFGLSTLGEWILVDTQGDGAADGYVHGGYLETIAGGFPLDYPDMAVPYQIARKELEDGVREYPGSASNPRIYLYHASTGHGAEDDVALCSSFLNYCVEMAGYTGTNSKAARSWHDQGWGDDVTDSPCEGDIAVWRRRWTESNGKPASGGHVGFVVSFDATSVTVLGGNQSNRVSIATYPREGSLGGQNYKLLSIRRPRAMSSLIAFPVAKEAAE